MIMEAFIWIVIFYYVNNETISLNDTLYDCRFLLTEFFCRYSDNGAINTINNLNTFIQCVENNTSSSIQFMYSTIK